MNKIIQTAKEYISAVKDSGINVENAILFGSYAKGKTNKWSDIDICVVSSMFGKNYFAEEVKLRHLSINIDSRIEPVAFNPNDLNNKYDSLASEIRKYGISLTD